MSAVSFTLLENGERASLAGAVARFEDLALIDSDDPSRAVRDYALPSAVQPSDLDVPPGRYRVQLILPGGKIMTQTASVAPGEHLPLHFSIDRPSVGTVFTAGAGSRASDKRVTRADLIRSRPGMSRSVVLARKETSSARRSFSSLGPAGGGFEGLAGAYSVPRARPRSAPIRLAPGLEATAGESKAGGRGTLRLISQTLGHGPAMWDILAGREVPGWRHLPIAARRPSSTEDGVPTWRQRWRGSQDTTEVRRRRWGYAEMDDEVALASIPLPWFDIDSGNPVEVDLWHRETMDGDARMTLRVADPHLEGLLEVLRHGRLGVARAIVDGLERGNTIDRVIYAKVRNPLAACAAAYVGLAIFDPAEQERWDSWLPNIRNWFRWLPDGAILHARRIMLRPRDRAETEQILPALKEAFAAGIPYYSAGLQLMQEMMGVYCNDEESEEMAGKVNRIASRLDTAEAFTVLRYSKER
ncbi:MAG TPA: hypothetical protein VF535_00475 [Allosphingosinicella sp.]